MLALPPPGAIEMENAEERTEKTRTDAAWEELHVVDDQSAVTVEERDQIGRLARNAGICIDVSKVRGRPQARRILRTLELLRSRMR